MSTLHELLTSAQAKLESDIAAERTAYESKFNSLTAELDTLKQHATLLQPLLATEASTVKTGFEALFAKLGV